MENQEKEPREHLLFCNFASDLDLRYSKRITHF